MTDTLLRTVYEVAAALNGREYILEIDRCSTKGSICADAISKADFSKFYDLMPNHNVEPERIPTAFVQWINRPGGPIEDRDLGEKIIRELKDHFNMRTIF